MTRDQLIEKRKKKKRIKRITAGAALIAVGMLAFGSYNFAKTHTFKKPVSYGAQEITEVGEIIPAYSSDEGEVIYNDDEDEDTAYEPVEEDAPEVDQEETESAPPQDSWIYTDEGVFYRYADGTFATDFVWIDGALYCFGYDGVMLDGWQNDGDLVYYFSPEDGKAVTGEQVIDGVTYYFDENGINDPEKTVKPEKKKKTEEAPAGYVALTFDDGPGYYTDMILDLLDEYGAKATFFMIGQEVVNYPDAVYREHEMGMEQGNHSWDHATLTHLSGEEIREEFEKTNDAITSITGDGIELFRAPGGGLSDEVFENSLGMKSIFWSIDTLDWETKNAQATYDAVINNVSDGDIILMHEIYQASYEAACMLIPKLQEMGYKLVTVSELAAIRGVEMENGESYSSFYP